MTKISALSDIGTSVASNDAFVLVDVSDPTTPNKKIQQQNLFLIPDGSAGTPAVRFLNDTDVGLFRPTTNTLALATGGSERLRITSAGLVGVGTSSPATNLEVYGAQGTTLEALRLRNQNAGVAGVRQTFWQDYLVAAFTASRNGLDGRLSLQTTDTSGNLQDRLFIDGSGNVGIGTTSAAKTLEVAAPNAIGSYAAIRINSPYYTTWDIANESDLVFTRNVTEAFRCDAYGRLLVGTSSSPSGGTGQYAKIVTQGYVGNDAAEGVIAIQRGNVAPNITTGQALGALTFNDSAGQAFGQIYCYADANAGTNDYPGRLVFSTTADNSASPTERLRIRSNGQMRTVSESDGHLSFVTAAAGTSIAAFYSGYGSTAGDPFTGTVSCFIWSNGNIQNTNNSYTAISDIKLKENVVDAGSQWADLKALRVRNYNLKEGQTHKQIGLVAQEVELISPGLVGESPDRDAEGNDLGTVTKSVNYSVLYMKAVKALQEAMERIEQLEQRLTDAGIA